MYIDQSILINKRGHVLYAEQAPAANFPLPLFSPSPHMPAAFDIVVVGAGGGPDETNLSAYVVLFGTLDGLMSMSTHVVEALNVVICSYLLKPHDAHWEDGIIAVEAGQPFLHPQRLSSLLNFTAPTGSGQGALSRLLKQDPLLFCSSDDTASKQHTSTEIYSFLRLATTILSSLLR
jgi:hypothetical protein